MGNKLTQEPGTKWEILQEKIMQKKKAPTLLTVAFPKKRLAIGKPRKVV